MYQTLTFLHSIFRWLVLISLIYSIFRAYKGYRSNSKFSKTDDSVRHWTATIAHIQLFLGIILYSKSPIVSYFWKNFKVAKDTGDLLFFGLIHISLMLISIVMITIGSALAKRKETDKDKFRTILLWFGVGLLIILIAIPWPFSPLANRPYFR
ncbi:hypothetical protein PFY10_03155 [Chryseobacterium daecheongense]|nr:hypothetical protein PFY10_03155 [Chryseobacterium daecheongense]